MEKTNKSKNLFEGSLNKKQLEYLRYFIARVRTERNAIVIEIPFPKENWTIFKNIDELARSVLAQRE